MPEVVVGCGHEVLVANPRRMDGTKRRKRKNDRRDAHKLARLGRVDPQSLFPIEHPGYGSAARPGGAAGAGGVGVGADGINEHHAGIGEEHGYTAAQVFQPELSEEGGGGTARRATRSAAAAGPFGGDAE